MRFEILTDRKGLLDLIHYDKWFDLRLLAFEKALHEVRFYLGHHRKGPYNRVLVVTDVSDVSVRPDAARETYELYDIRFATSSVQLLAAPALEIPLAVGDHSRLFFVDRKSDSEAGTSLAQASARRKSAPSTAYPDIRIDRNRLLDLVHDRWFLLDQFAFDREKRQARLYLGDRHEGPYDQMRLTITDVVDVSIDDPAKIQRYDLSDIELATSMRITTGAGLEIVLTVTEQCRISLLHEVLDKSV